MTGNRFSVVLAYPIPLYFFVSEDYLHETSKAYFTFLVSHVKAYLLLLFLILGHHISGFSSKTNASASSTS